MNTFEKVVKAFALFLAGIIILSIISGITFGLTLASHIFDGGTNKTKDYYETFTNINKLDIDVRASEISIESGEVFTVEGYDLTDSFTVKEKNGTLIIEEEHFGFWNFKSGKIVITVPKNITLEDLHISSGAGKIKLDHISSNNFDLDQGAGLVEINNATLGKTQIDGGAGKIEIIDSVLKDLDLSAGAGAVDIKALIKGSSKIDCGVGKLSLKLLGKKDDYQIRVEKGLGSIIVDNETYSSDSIIGNGTNHLKVEGGVGSIEIDFEE